MQQCTALALGQNIRATIKKVYHAAGLADKKEDAPQTKLPDMLNVIDASGAVDTETEFAKILLAVDVPKEIQAIDTLRTRLKYQTVLGTEENDGLLQQLTDLGTLKLLVPPFVSIVKCERACSLVRQGTPVRTKEETDVIEAMNDMLMNTKSFVASELSTIATTKVNFGTWKNNKSVLLRNMTKTLYEELRTQATQIRSKLFDLDYLSRPANVEECVDTLRNWSGNKELVTVLKTFTGAEGRGVKHFEAMTNTLSCAGIFSPGPEMRSFACVVRPQVPGELGEPTLKTYKELKDEFCKIRQSARLQLTMRSASIIIHNKDAASLPVLEKDIKPLKVTLPKSIRDKMAELKK